MTNQERFYHWCWAENKTRPDNPNYLINLEHGICIRFDAELAMFADYDTFYRSIADVQLLAGTGSVDESIKAELLVEAWNYLATEEQILEADLNEIEDDLT